MDLRLAGRKALITGGARDIGRAIAAAFVAEGGSNEPDRRIYFEGGF